MQAVTWITYPCPFKCDHGMDRDGYHCVRCGGMGRCCALTPEEEQDLRLTDSLSIQSQVVVYFNSAKRIQV